MTTVTTEQPKGHNVLDGMKAYKTASQCQEELYRYLQATHHGRQILRTMADPEVNGCTHRTLTDTAYGIVIKDLLHYGNKPCEVQREALYELVAEMTRFAQGITSGRRAFSLATGCGKTSAIIAWITALHRLGLDHVAVSVAASKVSALCDIKKALIAHGVPEELIGIKYANHHDDACPSTGNEDRRYQLVTHARVRGGNDHDLFIHHQGKARALMIYDETLFRSDAVPVPDEALRMELAALREWVRGKANEEAYAGLLGYLSEASGSIWTALQALKADDTDSRPMTITLPALAQPEFDGYQALLVNQPKFSTLSAFLKISQEELRVSTTQQGGGVIWYEVSIPPALQNVLILDASYPVRKLVHLDSSITNGSRYADARVKRFDQVTIHHMKGPSGRSALQENFRQARREDRNVSREVVEVVKATPENKAILIFTFKHRPGEVNIPETIRGDLREAGVDVDAVQPDGKQRINLLTWGDETSLNTCSHCEVVILAGVLHLPALEIASRIIGQQDDLRASAGNRLINEMQDSEQAHLIYQAISRGSCRVVELGSAKAMDVYLIHSSLRVRPLLDRVMPGVRWKLWTPKFIKAEAMTATDLLAMRIWAYLQMISDEDTKVTNKEIKLVLEIESSDAARKLYQRAINQLVATTGEWTKERDGLMRKACLFDSQ